MPSPLTKPESGLLLLSFDGGGQYCLSQLLILREVMLRIEHDLGATVPVLPCEYFHLVAGVEMGGLVAALLVLFRMSVDEAIETYTSIIKAYYGSKVNDDKERNVVLRRELERLLSDRALALDTPLVGDTSDTISSKLLLCAANKATMETVRLRNYNTRGCLPSTLSILDALLATCTPSSVDVGSGYNQEVYINGTVIANNPTSDTISEAYSIYGKNSRISCLLNIGAKPREQAAIPENAHTYKEQLVEILVKASGDQIANEVARRMAHLGRYFRFCSIHAPPAEAQHTDTWIGELEATTHAYLEDVLVSNDVDDCVSKLQTKVGVKESGLRLPKPTSHFVMRDKPWSAMKKALFDNHEDNQDSYQRIMIISGMGGSGKTQLARKFIQQFKSRYQYICFIDGSSAASIEEDLIANILSIESQKAQKVNLEHALRWLANNQNWLIVFDNVDDNVDKPLDLRSFFPKCDHGSILVTTRNPLLGQIAPTCHYNLREMETEEATKALLKAALPFNAVASPLELGYAQAIVTELGCLPVAIIQAGSYIRQLNCLPDYLARFRLKRADILSRKMRYEVDDYHESVYAVLETTRNVLSTQALKTLHLLSYFHYTNIPDTMILKSAQDSYTWEAVRCLGRSFETSQAVALLVDVLGNVDFEGLDVLIGKLQIYSLVEFDRASSQRVLRLHPIVQAWAQDALTFEDPNTYREAAVRIISSCAGKENRPLYRFILPHVRRLSPHWGALHPNDKAAFAEILWAYSPKSTIELLDEAHEQVKNSTERDELAYAELLLKRGKGYFHMGDFARVETLNKEAIEIRKKILPPFHPDTFKARTHLGSLYLIWGRYPQARKQQVEIFNLSKEHLGAEHPDTVDASAKLALTLARLGRHGEAKDLQEKAFDYRRKNLGEKHPDTLTTMSNLARTYAFMGLHVEAEKLREEVVNLRKEVLGENHIDTIISEENLAVTYYLQGRYEEARKLQESTVQRYQAILEPGQFQTAIGMSYLAETYYKLGLMAKAEEFARQADKTLCRSFTPGSMHYERPKAVLRRIWWQKQMSVFLPACFCVLIGCFIRLLQVMMRSN